MLLFQIGPRVNSRSAGACQGRVKLEKLEKPLTCDWAWHIVIGITMAGRLQRTAGAPGAEPSAA